MSSRYGPSVMG